MYQTGAILLYGIPLAYYLGMACWLALGWFSLVWLLKKRRAAKQLVAAGGSEATTVPAQKRRSMWLANLGLSVWLFMAGCTLLELYFAFVFNQSDSFNLSNVSKAWHMRYVQRNVEGFRDDQSLAEKYKQPGQKVWFIGDSFTFGHGVARVADRFSDLIGRDLAAKHPGQLVVANLAETGINTADVRKLTESIIRAKLKPDLLVYVICPNDIDEPLLESGSAEHQQPILQPPYPLFSHTYFLNLLWFRVKQATHPKVRDYYSELATAYKGRPALRMLAEIDRLKSSCKAAGIQLRIAVFPFLHNLGPKYPFGPAHALLLEHCREVHIPVMDLYPALEPHAGEGLVVGRFDAHPNERAHALAAEALEKNLLRDLFDAGSIRSTSPAADSKN